MQFQVHVWLCHLEEAATTTTSTKVPMEAAYRLPTLRARGGGAGGEGSCAHCLSKHPTKINLPVSLQCLQGLPCGLADKLCYLQQAHNMHQRRARTSSSMMTLLLMADAGVPHTLYLILQACPGKRRYSSDLI